MPNSQVFFHAGAERTGTKYLQGRVFPLLQNICFIDRKYFHKTDKNISKSKFDKYLISYELNFKEDFERELEIFAKKYADAGIIMVFRDQTSWMESQYKRLIKNGHNLAFNEYLDLENNNSIYKTTNLLYFNKVKLIEKLFVKKPLILLYSDLRDNPYEFADEIAKYLGTSYDKSQLDLNRKHTSYNSKQLNALKKIMDKGIIISRRRVSNFFFNKLYLPNVY